MSNTPLSSAQRVLSLFVSTYAARPWRSFVVCLGKPITENLTVPTDGKLAVGNSPTWSWDGGVSYAAGSALTAVTGAPAVGQYAISAGLYSFNVGDALAKVKINYRFATLEQTNFPGALQAAFLADGFALSDLINGLAYAVTEGWLSTNSAPADDVQTFTLEQPGFAEAGGTAPTLAESGQQIVNVCAALNATPGAARFAASGLVGGFVGTVGGNTFAEEDLLPGAYYAVAQGWLRPTGNKWSDPVFALTAAGAAAAA